MIATSKNSTCGSPDATIHDEMPRTGGRKKEVSTSMSLSRVCIKLLDKLAEREGLNRTQFIEMISRKLARETGFDVEAIQAEADSEQERK
ncbi:MAG: ribbon-helix-helix domain-containing protein [Patescibacteria group bacterium]|nr:ribbon-helix-helix domain-containing protein [Patescibacteria group bacterium]